ncbi:hypothetical protein HYX16_04240 [Candidatus Woesearchaeota archaeon]|nr:hypothetical protein [Candidatus Woesearchaeota archaeon]
MKDLYNYSENTTAKKGRNMAILGFLIISILFFAAYFYPDIFFKRFITTENLTSFSPDEVRIYSAITILLIILIILLIILFFMLLKNSRVFRKITKYITFFFAFSVNDLLIINNLNSEVIKESFAVNEIIIFSTITIIFAILAISFIVFLTRKLQENLRNVLA